MDKFTENIKHAVSNKRSGGIVWKMVFLPKSALGAFLGQKYKIKVDVKSILSNIIYVAHQNLTSQSKDHDSYAKCH